MPSFRLLLITIVLATACGRAPSSSEAADLLRAAEPALDSTHVIRRVWADGPPWFSCAEVLAKVRTNKDSALIRGQLANWRSLVLAKWVVLRDTAKGTVVDPGWCRATLQDTTARLTGGWKPIQATPLPFGDPRLGWDVPAGKQRLVVREDGKKIGKDSASVDYLITVQANANGIGLGADKDTTRHQALLVRADGEWRVVQLDWPGPVSGGAGER
ncbi:hypothetical protein BH09GEM1_BH09GEM1_34610 [soil metagenome]